MLFARLAPLLLLKALPARVLAAEDGQGTYGASGLVVPSGVTACSIGVRCFGATLNPFLEDTPVSTLHGAEIPVAFFPVRQQFENDSRFRILVQP